MKARTFRYEVVAADIRHHIEISEFPPGARLPSEAELAARYGAGRVTVRTALERLRREGLVESTQGIGWHVSRIPAYDFIGSWALEQQLTSAGMSVSRELLAFDEVHAVGFVAETLGDGRVVRLSLVSSAQGVPMAYLEVHLPTHVIGEISKEGAERSDIRTLLVVPVVDSTQTITASPASRGAAKALGVRIGSPVLHSTWISRTSSGDAVILTEVDFPGHLAKVVLRQPQPTQSDDPVRIDADHRALVVGDGSGTGGAPA